MYNVRAKEYCYVIEDLLRKPDRESGGEAERTPVEGAAGQGPVCVHEGRGAERQFGEVHTYELATDDCA